MDHLIDTFGYSAVAFLVLAESFGIPLPGETAVIVAAAYAGHSHRLSVWVIFMVAAACSVAGGNIGYALGRFGGYKLARRYGHKVRLDARKLRIARYLFDTYGPLVVFLGRFVSILRTYAAFLAGTSRMNWTRFSAANAAGGIIWAALYSFIAYAVGNTLRRISGTLDLIVGGVAVAAVVVAILIVRHRLADLAARADAAYPGPPE